MFCVPAPCWHYAILELEHAAVFSHTLWNPPHLGNKGKERSVCGMELLFTSQRTNEGRRKEGRKALHSFRHLSCPIPLLSFLPSCLLSLTSFFPCRPSFLDVLPSFLNILPWPPSSLPSWTSFLPSSFISCSTCKKDRKAGRKVDRKADRQEGKKAGNQAGRQTRRQEGR